MPLEIEDKDLGLRRIVLDIKQLSGWGVKIGLMGNDAVDGVSVVDIGAFNEFGTSRMPARPFMSRAHDENIASAGEYLEHLAGDMIDGKRKPEGILNDFGLWYTSRVKDTIRNAVSWAVPNAASTVAMKGSSSPLIDKGRMIGAINYEIIKT